MLSSASNVNVLILPGWNNSGPQHWQTLWERDHPEFKRVVQKEWVKVNLEDWLATLDHAISESSKPTILVAHSLGCMLVAHWAKLARPGAQGALLVAPADVEREGCPPELRGFAPIPLQPLPFKSIVAASDDDPYLKPDRAQHFARCWKSEFFGVGKCGHIAGGLGDWPAGQELLARLL